MRLRVFEFEGGSKAALYVEASWRWVRAMYPPTPGLRGRLGRETHQQAKRANMILSRYGFERRRMMIPARNADADERRKRTFVRLLVRTRRVDASVRVAERGRSAPPPASVPRHAVVVCLLVDRSLFLISTIYEMRKDSPVPPSSFVSNSPSASSAKRKHRGDRTSRKPWTSRCRCYDGCRVTPRSPPHPRPESESESPACEARSCF
jgi:hypothetical protein